ncbi:MAG: GTPase [Caldilineaceae bacterium]
MPDNLKLLQSEEKLRAGVPIRYKFEAEDVNALAEFLATYHCVVAGVMADMHFLVYHKTNPAISAWLTTFLTQSNSFNALQIQWLMNNYNIMFKALMSTEPYQIPHLSLELARGLIELPDKEWASVQIRESTNQLLTHRAAEQVDQIADQYNLHSILNADDKDFFVKLEECLALLDESELRQVRDLLDTWNEFVNSTQASETQMALKLRLQENGKPIVDGPPAIFKLIMDEDWKDEKKGLSKYHFGREATPPYPEKVLMVVGATGAGKSTLINGMINYWLGVEWQDSYRYKLIVEEGEKSQSESQTKIITAYTLYKTDDSSFPYTVTIIDTPGFGDTGNKEQSGLERDKIITEQIRDFFSMPDGINHLDGIGFVIPSAEPRLTATQRYIFDSILSIFGKDISNNIFVLVTFADGQTPPVLEALKAAEVPYTKYFKFNNSALFATEITEEEDNFDAMFWKMGTKSLQNFFVEFGKAESRSLQLTKDVLKERQRLETTITGLRPRIDSGLAKIEELRQIELVLEQRRAEVLANKDFTIVVKVPASRRINLLKGEYTSNCMKCNCTCHYPCGIPNDGDKYNCDAMKGNRANAVCTICGCHWQSHVNQEFRYEEYEEFVPKRFKS